MRHVLSALVQNQPGVLAHVSGMFASRGFNIDSLAVGETEDPHLSRITVVVKGDDRHLEQVRKQLEKIVTVVKVDDISREEYVERDLMLIKVDATPERRAEVRGLVQDFRGRIVDVGPEQLMIEISGQEKKIEAFIELVRPYGIRALVRTGRIALVRSSRPAQAAEEDEAEPQAAVVGHSNL
jgi:acetolactate synthase-1/3 small subunit